MLKKERSLISIILILFLLFQLLPYIYGYHIQGEDKVFSGFILQWNDNNTYLAKMNQGAHGNWLFQLDYAQEPGTPTFIYPFYLLLGHIAHWFNLSLIFTYHATRLLMAVLMFFSLQNLVKKSFPEQDSETQTILFFVSLVGLGTSWLSIYLSRTFTSLVEAFPNTAASLTPHFAAALAILFYLLTPGKNNKSIPQLILNTLLTAVCAFLSPFTFTVLIAVLATTLLYKWMRRIPAKEEFWNLILIGNAGGWIVLYQYFTIQTHPILQIWSQQNIISKITFWNFLIGFSPLLIFTIAAYFKALKNRNPIPSEKQHIYLWGLIIPLMLLIPVNFSARFIIGAFVPISLIGANYLFTKFKNHQTKLKKIFLTFPLLVILLETFILCVITQKNSEYNKFTNFIPVEVMQAYTWINQNIPADSYILTANDTGNFLPRFTTSIPTLGHWCETPHINQQRQLTADYFSGNLTTQDLLQNNIDFIFYGPNETRIGTTFDTTHLTIIYQNPSVTLYQLLH